MKEQYKDTGSTPRIVPNVQDRKDKDLSKQLQELKVTVKEQDQLIRRMQRDISRLKETINQVSAKVK